MSTPEYKALGGDSKAQTKLIEESFEIFSTAVFLRGANQRKYGSLLEGYRGQYAGGRNHYPTTLLTAVDALRTHKADDKKKLKDAQKKNDKYASKDEGTGENSFAQNASERRCYACRPKNICWTPVRFEMISRGQSGLTEQTVNTISTKIQETLTSIPVQKMMMWSTLQDPAGVEYNCA